MSEIDSSWGDYIEPFNTTLEDSADILGKELSLTLMKGNNKESVVKAIVEEVIGSGTRSTVYKIRIKYPDGKVRYLAQKVMKKDLPNRDEWIKENVDKTLEKYIYLKSIKLPVRNTMRKSGDGKSLVMTLGSKNDKKILSINNASKDLNTIRASGIILQIDTEDIIQQLHDIQTIAKGHHTVLAKDAFFIEYDVQSKKSKVILADYDNIRLKNKYVEDKHNIEAIKKFVGEFYKQYEKQLDTDKRADIEQKIANF